MIIFVFAFINTLCLFFFAPALDLMDNENYDSYESNNTSEDLGETTLSVDWFVGQTYDNKDDVVNAVINYHRKTHREFTVCKSDKERYYIQCKVRECGFKAHFFFRGGLFGPPKMLAQHTCDVLGTYKTNRETSAKFLAQLPNVLQMLAKKGREMSMADMQMCVQDAGITTGYKQCCRGFKRAKETFFIKDVTQYAMLPAYTEMLNQKGHYAQLKATDNIFQYFGIVFREGRQKFRCMPCGAFNLMAHF